MHHKSWYSMINIPTTMIVKITSTHLPYTLYFDMAHILCCFIFSPLWDLPMVKEKGSGSFSEVFILMSMVFWPSTFRASLSTVHFLPARVTPLANRVLRSLAMIALTSDAWRRHTHTHCDLTVQQTQAETSRNTQSRSCFIMFLNTTCRA